MSTLENAAAAAERGRLTAAFRKAVNDWNGHGPKQGSLHAVIEQGEALYFAAHALIEFLENDEKHKAPYCHDHCTMALAHLEAKNGALQAMLKFDVDQLAIDLPPPSNILWRYLTRYNWDYVNSLPDDSRDKLALLNLARSNWRAICVELAAIGGAQHIRQKGGAA